MAKMGRFVWKDYSANLHYTEEDRIYRLIPLDNEGVDFLFLLDLDYEIALHEGDEEIVNMVVIATHPDFKAMAR